MVQLLVEVAVAAAGIFSDLGLSSGQREVSYVDGVRLPGKRSR